MVLFYVSLDSLVGDAGGCYFWCHIYVPAEVYHVWAGYCHIYNQKMHCNTIRSRFKSRNILSHLPTSVIMAHHPYFLNDSLSLEFFVVPNDMMMKTSW